MIIGPLIRRTRVQRNIALRALARAAGVDPAYVSRVERGLAVPSEAFLRAAAGCLGVTHEPLFLAAGRFPPEWQPAVEVGPFDAASAIRNALTNLMTRSISTAQSPKRRRSKTSAEAATAGVAKGSAWQESGVVGRRAIEEDDFPFEWLSSVAEVESWRKEVNRPLYYLHKWWAHRLGSVFRGAIIGALSPAGANVVDLFYSSTSFEGRVVFDPFMGSGTTIGEALKLGARAIGRDINPVAVFAVRNALRAHSRQDVEATFACVRDDLERELRSWYSYVTPDGNTADVLYYFWVMQAGCPHCAGTVDLFPSRIFARHALPSKHPEAQAVCPRCGEINEVRYDSTSASCKGCTLSFDPQVGAAAGAHATCPHCSASFGIAKTLRESGHPPGHRMYAKLVLRQDGAKQYLRATETDVALYENARDALNALGDAFPNTKIEPGYNTDQALGYGYTAWNQFFNARQLLCIALLGRRLQAIPDPATRELFLCLLSGVLEFNNMFASYKGEGTGAVRHMFAHHILKPERMALEANIWGTPKSSGAFSTLFKSRLLRLLDYAENPFEVATDLVDGKAVNRKVYGLSRQIGHTTVESGTAFTLTGGALYLSAGNSAAIDIPDSTVDAVVTDPPFFDNVHYSQLADFFHVWQRHLGAGPAVGDHTTRHDGEVQCEDEGEFATRLGAVLRECARVLRTDGILVFSYHHSRAEGWWAVLDALNRAGFVISAVHPVKAEMSVAAPKAQAKEPIDLDVLIVCRRRGTWVPTPGHDVLPTEAARDQVSRLNASGRRLSRNDVRVVLMSQLLRAASQNADHVGAAALRGDDVEVQALIEEIHRAQAVAARVR